MTGTGRRLDVAIIGSGHNGLAAAAYLARAGRSVLVLEQRHEPGGTVGTEEPWPGFRLPLVYPSLDALHPRVVAELELESHGLRLLPRRGGTLVLREDDRAPLLVSAEAVRGPHGLPPREAQALAAFEKLRSDVTGALAELMASPLPELAMRPASLASLLRTFWRLRRGGEAQLEEVLRLLPMSLRDVLDERFESEALKAALSAPALAAAWMGPRSPGSLWNLLVQRPAWIAHVAAAPLFAAGGPGALTRALAGAARAAGVEIRTASRVERILTRAAGASGVALEDGTELAAARVLSGVDPKRTLLELVGPGAFDDDLVWAVQGLRSRGNVALARMALDCVPRFVASESENTEAASGRIQIGASLDHLERAWDACKYGRISGRPLVELTVPSLVDPSLAPAGKAVMTAWVQYAPYALANGSWQEERTRLGAKVAALIEEHVPGFTSSILHLDVLTPVDIETRFGLTQGCVHHLEPAPDQTLWLRPLPRWYRHRTPIDGLYLCGPGTHPGGGVSGLCGRGAARQILSE